MLIPALLLWLLYFTDLHPVCQNFQSEYIRKYRTSKPKLDIRKNSDQFSHSKLIKILIYIFKNRLLLLTSLMMILTHVRIAVFFSNATIGYSSYLLERLTGRMHGYRHTVLQSFGMLLYGRVLRNERDFFKKKIKLCTVVHTLRILKGLQILEDKAQSPG